MEQNEAGFQAPILCVNNCGFFGSVTTMNLCSKCYKDMVLKQEQAKLAASSIESSMNMNGGSSSSVDFTLTAHDGSSAESTTQVSSCAPPEKKDNGEKKAKEGPKRCSACRKRVGLTGFECRCGDLFCAIHRYSDKHECPFDYQKAAQDAIANANPVVKAEKLDKI